MEGLPRARSPLATSAVSVRGVPGCQWSEKRGSRVHEGLCQHLEVCMSPSRHVCHPVPVPQGSLCPVLPDASSLTAVGDTATHGAHHRTV